MALPPLDLLAIDLEVRRDRRGGASLRAFAALRGPEGPRLEWQEGGGVGLDGALEALDALAEGAQFLVAHNGRAHDLPFLRGLRGGLALLKLPLIDTLELSPLAFPRNPYHRLVKDYKLVGAALSDPLEDCRLTLSLLDDALAALGALPAPLFSLYGALLGALTGGDLPRLIEALGGAVPPPDAEQQLLEGALLFPDPRPGPGQLPPQAPPAPPDAQVCLSALGDSLAGWLKNGEDRAALAYLLAWLTTAEEGRSVLPPWVRHQHPRIQVMAETLRQRPCALPGCGYCQRVHGLEANLERYFGYPGFRPDAEGGAYPLQRRLTEALSQGRSILGVLPTGGGKSLCYQLPALMLAAQRKAMTVVISPLQSLMKDQVDVLRERFGVPNVAGLYGGLTPLERKRVIDGVTHGEIDLLYVSPEQLRNRSFVSLVAQREVGLWVIDEAHCLSKWGHDFRPDYLYIAPFIKGYCAKPGAPVPVLGCFTATARQEVIEEIRACFQDALNLEMEPLVGRAERPNLQFLVMEASRQAKLHTCVALLSRFLQDAGQGSAVIYASSRRRTEELAEALSAQGWQADRYHAGLGEARPAIQDAFIKGDLQVIVATNAFGMGVDKPDVRLVVHADIPGSLEAYLQEAGRAGRDGEGSVCVLLFEPLDVEAQFRLQALNRLSLRDVQEILRGLRGLRKRVGREEIVATAGEILREPSVSTEMNVLGAAADTKVRAAILTLEQAALVERGENRYEVFQGALKLRDPRAIERRLKGLGLPEGHLKDCLTLVEVLLESGPGDMHSTDALSDRTGISAGDLLRVMRTLREAQIADLSLQLTAFVTLGGATDSRATFRRMALLERAILTALDESGDLPGDAGPGGESVELSVGRLTAHIKAEHDELKAQIPEVRRLLFALGQAGAWRLRKRGLERFSAELRRTLPQISILSRDRLEVARRVLDALVECAGAQRGRQHVSFTLEDLAGALAQGLLTQERPEDAAQGAQRALLLLHDLKIILLQGGLTVLRPAMALKVLPDGRRFKRADYEPLDALYRSQVAHIHIMHEYARLGLSDPEEALAFVQDYFELGEPAFLERYFEGREEALARPTLDQTYHTIVDALGDDTQQTIVTSQARSLLVLAGPGSGKTRVVVHRVAYLLSVERVDPRRILVLSFNRAVAREIRARLGALAGDDARWVSVHTYHGLALRIVGLDLRSPEVQTRLRSEDARDQRALFDGLLADAAEILEGGGDDADDWHREVLQGWRYIFVDEYQDVNADQYRLIRALTGLHLKDRDAQLTLMAVGDDDQSIYAFADANVTYIRRFEVDYAARRMVLLTNHRSAPPIVRVSSALIAHNGDRMKAGLPLASSRPLAGAAPVTLHRVPDGVRALRLAAERVDALHREGRPLEDIAVLAAQHSELEALARLLEAGSIPFHHRRGTPIPFHRVRQVRRVLDILSEYPLELVGDDALRGVIEGSYGDAPLDAIGEELLALVTDWAAELGGGRATAQTFSEVIYDRSAEPLRTGGARGRVTLSTLHGAKGLEFGAVIALMAPMNPGPWEIAALEEARRLLYVGMTRAKDLLHLVDHEGRPSPFVAELLRSAPSEHLREERPTVALRPGDELAVGLHLAELGLKDLWTSFGARGAQGLMGRRIASLERGDPLEVRAVGGGISLRSEGVEVGRLSRAACQPWLDPEGALTIRVERAEVAEICVLDRLSDGDEPFPRWEIVVPRIWWRSA